MKLIDIETIDNLSEFFKSFSDPTRLRILDLLVDGELSVNEIVNKLNLGQSLVSHQLKNLKLSNFVKSRRQGKSIIYFIADEHIKVILEYGLAHINER